MFKLMRNWQYYGLAYGANMYFLEAGMLIIDHRLIELPKEIQVLDNIKMPWKKLQGKDHLPKCLEVDEIVNLFNNNLLLKKLSKGQYKNLEQIEITHNLVEVERSLCRVIRFKEVDFYILEKYYDVLMAAGRRAAALDKTSMIKCRPGKVFEFFLLLDGEICGWFSEFRSEQITLDEALNDKQESIRNMYETESLYNEANSLLDEMGQATKKFVKGCQDWVDKDDNLEKISISSGGKTVVVAEKKDGSDQQEEIEFPEPGEPSKPSEQDIEGQGIVFCDHEGREIQYIDRLVNHGLKVGIILMDDKRIFWVNSEFDDDIQEFKTKKALKEQISLFNQYYEESISVGVVLIIPHPSNGGDKEGYTFRSQTDRGKCNAAGLTVFRDSINGVKYTNSELTNWHSYDENNHELMLQTDMDCITEEFLFTDYQSPVL
jgi:hypothetical protein